MPMSRRGDVECAAVGLELAGNRYQRGAQDAECTAEGDAAGPAKLEGTDVARSISGQAEAMAGDLDLRVAREGRS